MFLSVRWRPQGVLWAPTRCWTTPRPRGRPSDLLRAAAEANVR